MRIHEDHNGVYANAISKLADGTDVEGHQYDVVAGTFHATLKFQQGAIKEAGGNGLTNEALLAILAHRLNAMNKKMPCRENAIAITNIEQAQLWLEKRTRDRLARGVEGTKEP